MEGANPVWAGKPLMCMRPVMVTSIGGRLAGWPLRHWVCGSELNACPRQVVERGVVFPDDGTDHAVDEPRDGAHVGVGHPARRDRWGADADAGRVERWPRVFRHR